MPMICQMDFHVKLKAQFDGVIRIQLNVFLSDKENKNSLKNSAKKGPSNFFRFRLIGEELSKCVRI